MAFMKKKLTSEEIFLLEEINRLCQIIDEGVDIFLKQRELSHKKEENEWLFKETIRRLLRNPLLQKRKEVNL